MTIIDIMASPKGYEDVTSSARGQSSAMSGEMMFNRLWLVRWWSGFPLFIDVKPYIYMIVRLVRCYRTYTRLPDTYMVAIHMQGCQVYTGLSYIFRVAKHIHGCHSWTVLLDNLSLDLLNVTGSNILHNLLRDITMV